MKLVVDTGVFSAALSRRRRPLLERHVVALRGHQLFLSVVTVAELRYGALVAGWGVQRRTRLEDAIAATTVIPVSDEFLTGIATLRARCRRLGHAIADSAHSHDLWIAATALYIGASVVSADRVFEGIPGLLRHPGIP